VQGFAQNPATIRAYHGGPHNFDRFDMSKIGTGEGAQVYGHGLYFAGEEAVAKGYRDAMEGRRLIGGEAVDRSRPDHYAAMLEQLYGSRSAAVRGLKESGGSPELMAETMRILRGKNALPPVTQSSGHMYEVNLNTEPNRLLNWDAPIAAQPDVNRALKSIGSSAAGSTDTGADFLRRASRNPMHAGDLIGANTATPDIVAKALKEAGIDGVQYLDAVSRGAGKGSQNYVMFDDKQIEILRRYGLLPLATGGAAAAGTGTPAAEGEPRG